jgi:hypothetical protein
MLKRLLVACVVGFLAGCGSEQRAPAAMLFTAPLFARGNADFNLGTHLTGHEEVFTPATPDAPSPADSRAQGQAIFRVSDDGSAVEFKLIASNIENINQAHIHCGRFGENGPIRMWLHPNIGPTGTAVLSLGRHSGVLASGTFSPTGITCPATAVGQEMPLLDAIRAGLTYVNVPTTDGVAPVNTGPGDFPGGEIRGQIDRGR